MCVVLAFFTRNNASNSHLEASTVQGWTNYRARVDKLPCKGGQKTTSKMLYKPRFICLSGVSRFGRSKSIYEYSIENLINSTFAESKANKNKALSQATHTPPRAAHRKQSKSKNPKQHLLLFKKSL